MRLLITGAGGQLGSELQRVLDAGRSELGAIPDWYRQADVTPVDLGELNIADTDAVRSFFSRSRFDLIINCAAMTDVDGCESDPEAAMKANAAGARNLAYEARKADCRLVHVSTDYVFDGAGTVPYREWDDCLPNTVYGKSKLLGEQYVRETCPKAFIVRTSWLYGYSGGNFVKTILRLGRERGALRVVDDQRGNPTNAVDLAHHILKLAATRYYGVYHCTGGGECSWYDFARFFVELAGFPCEILSCSTDEFPRAAPRPAYSSLDNLMLRCTVGDGMRDWKDAVREYMTHYDRESGDIIL